MDAPNGSNFPGNFIAENCADHGMMPPLCIFKMNDSMAWISLARFVPTGLTVQHL